MKSTPEEHPEGRGIEAITWQVFLAMVDAQIVIRPERYITVLKQPAI